MGGRKSHEVHQSSHSRSKQAAGSVESSPHALELRRSSRLGHHSRSDYSLAERWSYGPDVTYETRYDTARAGDRTDKRRKRVSTSDRYRKKRKLSLPDEEDCVAHCTRSRTARKSNGSACELTQDLTTDCLDATRDLHLTESGGLLPLEDRDFAYSPFSSAVTELSDSEYSVYSPTSRRSKGKKRKRSTHRLLSHRKNSYLLNLEECNKRHKLDSHKDQHNKTREDGEYRPSANLSLPNLQCAYQLRNRRELGGPTATVTRDPSGKRWLFLFEPNWLCLKGIKA